MTSGRTKDSQFHDFFLAQSEPLRRFALFLTADREAAVDLAQETLARVYRSWSRIKDSDPGPYARRTLVNLVRSEHRKNALRALRDRDSEPIDRGEATRIEEWMRIAAALKTLPPIRRAVIVLRFYEDLTEPEIARILDRPLGTVKSDIHRALTKLRPLLDEARRGDRTEEVS